jgi:hypothetical protein
VCADLFHGGDEIDGEEEARPEFMCPFCADDFDVVGLCCHMDEEHPVEMKNGVMFLCICAYFVEQFKLSVGIHT